jgi:hypothetical protein
VPPVDLDDVQRVGGHLPRVDQPRDQVVVVLHVVSPDEADPRLTGEVELIDAETNEVLQVGVSLDYQGNIVVKR